ncbi:MAG: antitoxin family protein [Chloroflexota bacterium]
METIQVVYAGGVFKPLIKPNLPDGTTVDILIVHRADATRRAAALARARQLRQAMRQRRGQPLQIDIPALINEMRGERDNAIVHASRGD